MTKLFLDTNIVIDLLANRKPFCDDAVRLFTMAYNNKVKLIVSPITYTTASYLLRKQGSERMRSLLSNLHQLVQVGTVDQRVINDSLASVFQDFEDAVQYYTALKSKSAIIITRNGKDFSESRIPVMTAGEYLASIDDLL